MPFQDGLKAAGFHVPQSDALIAASRGDDLTGRIEGQSEYFTLMSTESTGGRRGSIGKRRPSFSKDATKYEERDPQ